MTKNKFFIRFAFVLLLAVTVVVIYGVFDKIRHQAEQEVKITQMERTILGLRSTINIDAKRQYQIQKITHIIDLYNVDMPAHKKYEIAEEIYSMNEKYSNLNVDLICATITHESAGTWDPEIVSPAGALGLMQVMPTTGMFVATFEDIMWTSAEEILFDPIYNIRIGCRYLSSLIASYDVDGGLAAYNGGEHRAALWLGSGKAHGILAQETQEYVPAVTKLYSEFVKFKL
ncbi:transglycosylase SLT domain-containing protein [candidate division KSB1 bacterium]|nr:transglycosylase SLT domain-containing protein [candidate division KSB1 bacterium]